MNVEPVTLNRTEGVPSLLQDCILRLRTRQLNCEIRAETSPLILFALIGVFLPWLAFAGHGVEDTVDSLSTERVKQLMDAGEKIVFVDLRPAKEYQQKRLPGARSIPIAEVANRFNEIPKSGRVVLYCDCKPYDVADRAVFLEYRGYRNVFIMPEGYSGWVKRGYPLETTRR